MSQGTDTMQAAAGYGTLSWTIHAQATALVTLRACEAKGSFVEVGA